MTKAEIREMAPGRQVEARRWLGVRASAFGIDSSFADSDPPQAGKPCHWREAGRVRDPFWRQYVLGGIGWNPRRPHDILQLPHERPLDHALRRAQGREHNRTARAALRFSKGGDRAGTGRLDKSGDVSGLASRHGDSTWRAGGTYEKIPEIGIQSTGNPRPRNHRPDGWQT